MLPKNINFLIYLKISMRVDKKGETIASCQMLNSSKNSLIRLWSVRTLSTLTILKDVSITNVIDMEFTINVSLLKLIRPTFNQSTLFIRT